MTATPDIHIPATVITGESTFSPNFIRRLLISLSGIIAIDPDRDPVTWTEEWQMLQELFWSFKPTNPVEAVLAAHAVDAHHRSMQTGKRAAQPGLAHETMLRLHASANAARRAFHTTLHRLEKQQRQGAPAESQPIPIPLFTPSLPAPTLPSDNGFANRAARRAAAALARKSARHSLNGK